MVPRLVLVLPPGWTVVPLADAAMRRRVVDGLVERLAFDDGQGARLRRDLRDRLRATVDDAAHAGATTYAIATSGPGGVPLPASLVVTPVPAGGSLAEDAPWLTAGGGRVDTATLPAGRVVRRVATRSTALDAGAEPLPAVVVDYWLTAPDGTLLHLAASTPLVLHEDAMVDLFDAIVEAARWAAPPT